MAKTTMALSLRERLTVRHFRKSVPKKHRVAFDGILIEMLDAERGFATDPRTREHIVAGSSVIAAYRCWIAHGLSPQAAKGKTGTALARLWKRTSLTLMRFFYGFSRDPFEAVRRYTIERIATVYGPAFVIEHEEWPGGFASIVTTCGFRTFLMRHDALSLLHLFCQWDRVWIDALPQSVRFDRPRTIAEGAACCRFEFTRAEGSNTDQC